jgi:hypothetical protein
MSFTSALGPTESVQFNFDITQIQDGGTVYAEPTYAWSITSSGPLDPFTSFGSGLNQEYAGFFNADGDEFDLKGVFGFPDPAGTPVIYGAVVYGCGSALCNSLFPGDPAGPTPTQNVNFPGVLSENALLKTGAVAILWRILRVLATGKNGHFERLVRRMAERVGFEPTVEFPRHSLSRRALSTAQTPLRRARLKKFNKRGARSQHAVRPSSNSLPVALRAARVTASKARLLQFPRAEVMLGFFHVHKLAFELCAF